MILNKVCQFGEPPSNSPQKCDTIKVHIAIAPKINVTTVHVHPTQHAQDNAHQNC